jgi:PAS domain S-box-containing protein
MNASSDDRLSSHQFLTNPLILIVDDQPANIHVLSEHLDRENFDVRVATSGQFALSVLEKVKPHLILLDIRMPGMDGFEVCRILKTNPDTAQIPIIFMSALDDVGSKMTGFELGAVDYITKPFEKNELIARVRTQIRINRLSQNLAAANASLQEMMLLLDEKVQQKTEQVKRQESLLRSTIDNAPIGIVNANEDGIIMTVNRSLCEMLGRPATDLIAQSWLTLIAPDYRAKAQQLLQAGFSQPELINKTEIGLLRQDQTVCTVILAIGTILDGDYEPVGFVLQIDDISELQASQQKVQIQERAINASRIGIVICDALTPGYPVIYANDAFTQISSYTEAEVLGKSLKFLQGNDRQPQANAIIRQALNAAQECEVTLRNYRKDGELYYLKLNIFPVFDNLGKLVHFIGVQNEITAQKQAEDRLKASLQEKDTLLKEIHHRVKNNLLVVSSLLSWQSETINDDNVLRIFEESQQRVYAMSLIHEHLYRSKNLSSIKMQDYLTTLVENIFAASHFNDTTINSQIMVDEAIALNVETSTACGLITNELILNALEHAFPRGHQGAANITVRLTHVPAVTPPRYQLTIQDDGVGLPAEFNYSETSSLGWQLICLLTEQIEGDLHVTSCPGTTVEITFPELIYQPRLDTAGSP